MLDILAQTTQDPMISTQAAAAAAAILGVVYTIVKIGDRLWGNKPKTNGEAAVQMRKIHDDCMIIQRDNAHLYKELSDNVTKLSEAMTKYAELQQASLKIEEYRHENILRQLEAVSSQVETAKTSTHARLDTVIATLARK